MPIRDLSPRPDPGPAGAAPVTARLARSRRLRALSARGLTALLLAALGVAGAISPASAEDSARTDSLQLVRSGQLLLSGKIGARSAERTIRFGRATDVIVLGDWDGDGVDTPAAYRAGTVYLSNDLSGKATSTLTFGPRTLAPKDLVVGDWNGDGKDGLAYKVAGSNRIVSTESTRGRATTSTTTFGRSTDTLVAGDWDGDGKDGIGVKRGSVLHHRSTIRSGTAKQATIGTGEFLVGDFDGDGKDTVATRSGNVVTIRNRLGSSPVARKVAYGRSTDRMLVADVGLGGGTAPQSVVGSTAFTPAVEKSWGLGSGYAANSVNTTVFRANSVATGVVDGTTRQFTAWYDGTGNLMLAQRALGSDRWTVRDSGKDGPVQDAHNSISIAVDGKGYLHVAWGMHSSALRYSVSTSPGSLTLTENRRMTGRNESAVTYPQFLRTSTGNLFFLYRDGVSGDGSLSINRYDTARGSWSQVASTVIDGEDKGSPYWQAALDSRDRIHLSWTVRRSGSVSTNSHVYYARATDATNTRWQTSTGTALGTRISATGGERIAEVPEGSNLMNQTSMTTDDRDRPYLVSYWNDDQAVPQYRLLRNLGDGWESSTVGTRTTPFDLEGVGTRSVPIARPQVVVQGSGTQAKVSVLIRDVERGSKVSMLTSTSPMDRSSWVAQDLTTTSVGAWEPSYDVELWREKEQLVLFVQNTVQSIGNGEQLADQGATNVYVVTVRG